MSDLPQDPAEPVKGEEHLSKHKRLARRLNLPDLWIQAVDETRRAGPKLVEEWEAARSLPRSKGGPTDGGLGLPILLGLLLLALSVAVYLVAWLVALLASRRPERFATLEGPAM